MKRKLIKQAGQAITVTLPIEWIRKNNLKSGNEVDFDIRENDLIISSGKKIVGNSIKLDISEMPRNTKYNLINAAYAAGVDKIKLEIKRADYPNFNVNIGYAIVDQKERQLIVKDIGGSSVENLDEIFKRSFQMIIGFYDSAIEDIFENHRENYEEVRNRDAEINKFVLFLQRAIMKKVYPKSSEGKIMFAYSYALEKIGDEILRLWRTDINSKVVKNKQVKEIINLSRQGISIAFQLYYNYDQKRISEFMKIRDEIREKASKVLSLDSSTSQFVGHAVRIFEDSYDMNHLSIMRRLK
jgi:phosphate uptake regulator